MLDHDPNPNKDNAPVSSLSVQCFLLGVLSNSATVCNDEIYVIFPKCNKSTSSTILYSDVFRISYQFYVLNSEKCYVNGGQAILDLSFDG